MQIKSIYIYIMYVLCMFILCQYDTVSKVTQETCSVYYFGTSYLSLKLIVNRAIVQ